MFDYQLEKETGDLHAANPAVIKVIGCGGGGGNAVNTMIDAGVQGVEFIVLNTDGQDLDKSKADIKIQIGRKNAGGLGAGGKPELGEEAAKESEGEIKDSLSGSNMVFITAGMGGGTGTGSAPVVAKIAREMGALTVAVVTSPFSFEGEVRARNAESGIARLKAEVDSLIVVPNDKIFEMREDLPVKVAFQAVTDILRQGVQGITDIIKRPGLVNRDFRDVESVMKGQGDALLGIGRASGDNRAIDAATLAISNPLLKDTHIDGAKNILINVSGNEKVSMKDCREIANFITQRAHPGANVIWGLLIDNDLEEEISVTVIATGFDDGAVEDTAKEVVSKPRAQSDSNFVSAGDFEKVARPQPQRQKTVIMSDDLLGSGIYEDNGGYSAPAAQTRRVEKAPAQPQRPAPQPQPQPQPTLARGGYRIPADFVADPDNLEQPAILRRNPSKLDGLPRTINLGK